MSDIQLCLKVAEAIGEKPPSGWKQEYDGLYRPSPVSKEFWPRAYDQSLILAVEAAERLIAQAGYGHLAIRVVLIKGGGWEYRCGLQIGDCLEIIEHDPFLSVAICRAIVRAAGKKLP